MQSLNDLKSDLEILNEKVLTYNRQNKLAEEKHLLDENISAVNKKLIQMESSAKKLSNEIKEIELKLDAIQMPMSKSNTFCFNFFAKIDILYFLIIKITYIVKEKRCL